MSKPPRRPPPSAVPHTRLGRLARLGLAAGELAVGGALEGLRRLGQGKPADGSGALFSVANARRLADRLAQLRGAAMKLGQLVSLQGDDMLPAPLAEALARLRADAAPMPPAQLHAALGRAWGKGWRERFDHFDDSPIAAASIGQVHRARTRDGRDLALKIQYPGVARSIASDVDNVALLLNMARVLPLGLDVPALVVEAKRQLSQEADYLAEARFLTRFATLVDDMPELVVPRVHADLTTARVMAMDFIDGDALDAWAAGDATQARRDALGGALLRLMLRELFEFRVMQTDPNFGNYLVQRVDGRLALLDFGATLAIKPELAARFAAITRGLIDDDEDAIVAGAVALGYVVPGEGDDHARAAVDVLRLVCEPLRHRGRYDFATSDLPARVRTLGIDLAFKRGLLRTPPADTLFLHRKMIGNFLLLARLGARVDARRMAQQVLQGATS